MSATWALDSDGFQDGTFRYTYPAVSFEPTWNGWAVPTVTREVLRQFATDHTAEGLTLLEYSDVCVLVYRDPEPSVETDVITLPVATDGTVTLDFGWTFLEATSGPEVSA